MAEKTRRVKWSRTLTVRIEETADGRYEIWVSRDYAGNVWRLFGEYDNSASALIAVNALTERLSVALWTFA